MNMLPLIGCQRPSLFGHRRLWRHRPLPSCRWPDRGLLRILHWHVLHQHMLCWPQDCFAGLQVVGAGTCFAGWQVCTGVSFAGWQVGTGVCFAGCNVCTGVCCAGCNVGTGICCAGCNVCTSVCLVGCDGFAGVTFVQVTKLIAQVAGT